MASHDDLVEVVRRLHTCGGRTDLLDGRQQEADQDGDDGDHHEQLDERESGGATPRGEVGTHQLSFPNALQGNTTRSRPDPFKTGVSPSQGGRTAGISLEPPGVWAMGRKASSREGEGAP